MMTVLEIIHKWYILREVKISAIYQYFSLDENQEDKKDGSENKILGIIHGLLDAAGILFEPADAINGAIYGIEGDKLNAAISLGSCIPLVGDIAKTGKYGKKGIKLVKELGEEGVEKVLKETIEGSIEETAEKITKEASEEITAQLEKNADDVVEEIAGKGGSSSVKNGATRAAQYSSEWGNASLDDAVEKFAPNVEPVVTSKGKVIYNNTETGISVVYDKNGNYFRIEDTTRPRGRNYLDINGNDMNNEVVNGNTRGRSKSDYQKATHFNNND